MRYPAFWIEGDPKPKGSWTPFKKKDGSFGMHHASGATAQWCRSATAQVKTNWLFGVLTGPVKVTLQFRLPQVSKAAQARAFPAVRGEGDLDKLVRGVYDAMTGVVFQDDAQVVRACEDKLYGEQTGCWVTVEEL